MPTTEEKLVLAKEGRELFERMLADIKEYTGKCIQAKYVSGMALSDLVHALTQIEALAVEFGKAETRYNNKILDGAKF